MGSTKNNQQKEESGKNSIVLLSVLGSILFLVLLGYVLVPSFEAETTYGKDGSAKDSTAITITDTVYKKGSDTAYYSSKKVTHTSPVKTVKPTPTYGTLKERLDTAFFYFLLIFGMLLLLLLLPRILSFTINKDGITATLSEKEKQAQNLELEKVNADAQREAVAKPTLRKVNLKVNDGFEEETKDANVEEDPQKGLWGGLASVRNRKMSASFKSIDKSEWVRVTLKVESLNTASAPLTDYVLFHLHPTFPQPNVKIYVINGIAEYSFTAWGAFTVGADADFGETFLELDLSQEPNAPEPFKSR